jgi:hypothetical protein
MKKLTKCMIACTVCKVWTLANALLISWLNFTFTKSIHHEATPNMYAHNEDVWGNWWAGPVAWSSGFGIFAAVVVTIIVCVCIVNEEPIQ